LTARRSSGLRKRSTFGLSQRIFEATSVAGTALAESLEFQALDRWLGALIRVESVAASSTDSTLSVDLRYRILANGNRRFLNLEIPSS